MKVETGKYFGYRKWIQTQLNLTLNWHEHLDGMGLEERKGETNVGYSFTLGQIWGRTESLSEIENAAQEHVWWKLINLVLNRLYFKWLYYRKKNSRFT